MIISLASPTFPASVENALQQLETLTKEAAGQQAAIICFPETFIPGYPLPEYNPEKPTFSARSLRPSITFLSMSPCPAMCVGDGTLDGYEAVTSLSYEAP